jgi:hypothetical protein
MNLTDFLQKFATDEDLKEKASQYFEMPNTGSLQKTLTFLNENGCNTTIEELKKYQEDTSPAVETDKTQDGCCGANCGCVVGGGGSGDTGDVPPGINKICACVLGGGGETSVKIKNAANVVGYCRCACVFAGSGNAYNQSNVV